MKISVFGATGFIGSRFCEMYPKIAIPIPRDQNHPESNDILYLISTTHNYGTWNENIVTNIDKLFTVLQQLRFRHTFNFISSWFVYGNVVLPACEFMTPSPKGGPYNLTKLWAEQLVQDYCNENGIPWRIFRLANVFGPNDQFSKKKNALQYLIHEMKHDRPIELYWQGKFYRDYIYVDDVCDILKSGMNIPTNEIYNVGCGERILFSHFILLAHELLNSATIVLDKEVPEFHKAIQVKDFWMDTSKIRKYGLGVWVHPYARLAEMLLDEMEN